MRKEKRKDNRRHEHHENRNDRPGGVYSVFHSNAIILLVVVVDRVGSGVRMSRIVAWPLGLIYMRKTRRAKADQVLRVPNSVRAEYNSIRTSRRGKKGLQSSRDKN